MTQLTDLKSRGHSLTKARKALVELLDVSQKPLSAMDLVAVLFERGLKVNKTTVYRELKFLVEQGLICEIDLGEGNKRYEAVPTSHHHHIVCQQCNAVTCLDMEDELHLMEQQITDRTGFVIAGHDLKFFGLCPTCVVLAAETTA